MVACAESGMDITSILDMESDDALWGIAFSPAGYMMRGHKELVVSSDGDYRSEGISLR